MMTTELWAIILVISATLVGAFGPILLKKASSAFNIIDFPESFLPTNVFKSLKSRLFSSLIPLKL